MTPEQKASYLIHEMMLSMTDTYDLTGATDCALLAVGEIVRALFEADELNGDILEYWIQVKYEIFHKQKKQNHD